MNKHTYYALIKLIVIGNSNTGKSSLLSRYVDDQFTSNFITTIGIDFKIKSLEFKGKRFKVQIWDTAGQERFRTIAKLYYRNVDGALLCYDCTNEESFAHITHWMAELNQYANKPEMVKIICGNKIDSTDQIIPTDKLQALAKIHNCKYFETSAKLNVGIDTLFTELFTDIYNVRFANNKAPIDDEKRVKLEEKSSTRKSCC